MDKAKVEETLKARECYLAIRGESYPIQLYRAIENAFVAWGRSWNGLSSGERQEILRQEFRR